MTHVEKIDKQEFDDATVWPQFHWNLTERDMAEEVWETLL